MKNRRHSLVYIGIKSSVAAFDSKTGAAVWRTLLPAKYKSSASFVTVVRDSEHLYAACAGELFALDPATGALRWHEPLKGQGTGLVSIATDLGGSSAGTLPSVAAQLALEAAAHAAHTAT